MSELTDEQRAELAKPLDLSRVLKRKGRGNTSLDYLAGHDVKRRANEIFGFGGWGSQIIELVEIAAVQVAKDNREGWHVGYRATVRVDVRGGLPFSDTGYGDGVEYGPASRVQACELATKEAVTDALKRALTGWGDQFGLILYAKAEEKQRINAQPQPETRGDEPRAGRVKVPRGWAELRDRLVEVGVPEPDQVEWLRQACDALGISSLADANPEVRRGVFKRACDVYVALSVVGRDLAFDPDARKVLREVYAGAFDGAVVDGPAWRITPTETDRPAWSYPDANPMTDEGIEWPAGSQV